jgi:hypothetical protein
MKKRAHVVSSAFAFLAAALVLSSAAAASADAYKPYSIDDISMSSDQAVMVIQEPGYESATHSGLSVQPPSTGNTDTRGIWRSCSGAQDPVCDMKDPSLDLIAWPIIPTCTEATSEICVEGLEVAAPNGDYQKATFLRSAKDGIRIQGDKNLGLVEGITPSLFDAPNAPNMGGTTTYAVRVQLEQHFDHRTGKYYSQTLQANVIPYVQTQGDFSPAYFDAKAKPGMEYNQGRANTACQWVEVGTCGMRTDFVEGTKIRLSFRVPENLGGWFSGRMKSPNIAVTKFSPTANRLVVEGSAVDVPQLAYVKAQADIQVEKTLNVGRGGTAKGLFWAVTAGGPGSEDVFKWVDLYRKQLNETAAGVSSYWRMMTVSAGQGGPCLADTSKVLGIVSTNAMGFDVGAPKFQSGSLNYQVTGLHYMPDGKTETEGTYDLVMRSDTARCLYGFSKAPVSATISVTGSSGESKTATTVVGEKDGWLKMAAYGFTFSSPTISVKLTQAGATSAVKTTITCAKGKLTKKVTAVNATCPAGYKKK